MTFPKPITTIEAVAQLKASCWDLVCAVFPEWNWSARNYLNAWSEAIDERKRVLGTQQAWKDYNGRQNS